MSAARVPAERCVNRNAARVSKRHRPNSLQRVSTGKRLKRNCPPARTYAWIRPLASRLMPGSR